MEALNTYKTEKTLAEQMNERLAEMKMTKAEAALKMNYSRAGESSMKEIKIALSGEKEEQIAQHIMKSVYEAREDIILVTRNMH